MRVKYQKDDLWLKHYTWTVDNRDDLSALDIGTELLDVLQGYEVLLFANTFLDMYFPEHTKNDLHFVEIAIAEHLPLNCRAKNDVSAWLGRHFTLPLTTQSLKKRLRNR